MSNSADLPPLPKNHLDHPENWATGSEPATAKQKGFVDVLAHDHKELLPSDGLDIEHMGKSEASAVIDSLKNGKPIEDSKDPKEDPKKLSGEKEDKKDAAPASPESKKRKNPSSEQEGTTEKTAEKEVKEGGAKEEVEGEDVAMDADDEASSSTNRKASTTKKEEKAEVEGSIGDDEKDEIKKLEADAAKQNGNGHAKENGKANGKAEAAENGEEETSNGSQKETDDEPVAKKAKLDTSDDSTTISNGNGTTNGSTTTTNGSTTAKQDETVPGDGEHLDHPENWTTGDEPATEKQKGYVAVLEKKAGKPVSDKEGLGKSEASEIIEKLKG